MEGADWRRRAGQSAPTTLNQPCAAPRRAVHHAASHTQRFMVTLIIAAAYLSSIRQCLAAENDRIFTGPPDAVEAIN